MDPEDPTPEETTTDLVVPEDDAIIFGMTTNDLGQMVIRTFANIIIGSGFMLISAKLGNRLKRRKVTEVVEDVTYETVIEIPESD